MARILRWLPVVLIPLLFIGALVAIAHEFALHHPREIAESLERLPRVQLLGALALTVASYGLLTLYDWFGLVYAGRKLPYPRVALASFTAFVFSYNIGVSVLGGAAVRYRLYSGWGLSALEIGKVVLFGTLTFWLGMAGVGGVSLLLPNGAARLAWGGFWPTLLGVALLAVVAGYVAACWRVRRPLRVREWELALPRPRLALGQFGLAALDMILAGAVLYVLLPGADVPFATFLGVYLAAVAAGLVSHVPGGLGVFESVVLLGLPTSATNPQLLASLVAFRAIYYLIPFAVGLVVIASDALLRNWQRVSGYAGALSRGVGLVAPRVLTFATFLAGAILLASGATPAVGSRLGLLARFLPLGVVELSHFLASVAGVGLLLLARALQLRLNAAWAVTLALLVAGAALSLLKGFDFEEAFALGATAAALALSRRHYRRRSSLWDHRFTPGWLLAITLVIAGTTWLGFFAFKHVEYSSDLWWTFEFKRNAPRFLRASVGVAAALAAFGLARLLRPARRRVSPATPEVLEAAWTIAAAAPETQAQLVALGDKAVLFSESRRSFLMYATAGNCWVALGDPVGDREEGEELAWLFREQCDAVGAMPVFYEVAPERLPLYVDLGMSLFKLGEEARVPLTGFTLEGPSRKTLRQTHARLLRDGCEFAVWEPEEVRARIGELRAVSDAWLASRKTREKGFSLGFFGEAYVGRLPAAVVFHRGRLVAFATLWRGGEREELSVDLMRHVEEAPPSTMEFLFIRLMLTGAAEGYRWFNLGMAPFSGIETHPLAPLWNRIGALLFERGGDFYNFQGLRRYKEKFGPQWRPRYLASPGGVQLPRILASVGSLVSGGLAGMVRK
ncbi:MAG: bifunctional lysylphosphatidylglycerol flippase/synthetase MprF [Opitutaceae bacterium]